MEIERKFLIKDLPFSLSDFKHREIIQAYLTEIGAHPERRIRKVTDSGVSKYFLTEKEGSGMVREEREREISAEEYSALRKNIIASDITKKRYFIPINGSLTVELDIYGGSLSGLAVAEVEFGSAEEAMSFEIPNWFGAEITDDRRYKNRSLAEKGLPK
jgi:CYTH domain-containing protein